MKRKTAILVMMFVAGLGTVFAQSTGTSARYTVLHAPPGDNGGGGPGANAGATVTMEISVGDPASGVVSNVTGTGVQAKGNLMGQLYDVTAVTVTAAPATVNENGARQLDAEATMDDATTLDLAGPDLLWSVVSGPVAGVSAGGLATGGIVFEDTAATVRGTIQGVAGDLGMTVLNVDADNYLGYGGDGLEDDWQVGFFGLPPNLLAAPGVDADGDNQDNRLENLAGVDPTDVGSRFEMRIDPVMATRITFSPVLPDRTYTLMSRTLAADWAAQPGVTESDAGGERMLTDTQATEPRKIYRIEIGVP